MTQLEIVADVYCDGQTLSGSDAGGMSGMGWQSGGGPVSQQQQLSVVTTVWGVTSTTQSAAPYTPGPPQAKGGPYAPSGYPSGSPLGPNKGYSPVPPSRQPPNAYAGYGQNPAGMAGGMPGAMGAAGHGTASEFQTGPSALSTAALVAAATATATATASVVALQEQRQQEVMGGQYGQMGGHQQFSGGGYGVPPQRGPPHGAAAAGQMGGLMGPTMGPLGAPSKLGGAGGPLYNQQQPPPRGRPYPSPQQYLAHKRQQQQQQQQYPAGPMQGGYMGTPQQQYGPQYPGATGGPFAKQQGAGYGAPASQGALAAYHQSSPLRGRLPGQGMPTPAAYPGSAQGAQYYQQPMGGPQTQYEQQFMQGGQYAPHGFQQRSMNYQHSPIPGNPTPPLTPASGMPPYLSPSQDTKPVFPDIKPPLPIQKDDELRLTFPVKDGIILAPFRLEHNLAVSNHVFHLKPSVHETLVWRSDLELQLKCFHHEDRQMHTNWPASVQVSVNATPLSIDRGESKTSHRPLYLKEVCQAGRNTVQITVTACCCSHLFLLQLVHRPTVRSVLQGLLRKRLLPAEHSIGKIKRNFSVGPSPQGPNTGPGQNPVGGTGPAEDGVEQTAIKVQLKCPITFKRITLPARGQECKHIQCFDLESYLQLNCERGSWRCPVCSKTAILEGLEVDQYMWGILTNLSNSDVEEVTIDATASWKPVTLKSIKDEHDGTESCSGGKRLKAMSPGSMTMPTTSSWEMGQGLAPYPALPPPDMQSIVNGPSMANGPVMAGGPVMTSGAGMPNGPVMPSGPSMSNGPVMGNGSGIPNGMGYGNRNGGFDFHSQASDFGSPLSHLSDSVASLDHLAAMEKSLNHHEQQMMPMANHHQDASAPQGTASSRHPVGGGPGSQNSGNNAPGTSGTSGATNAVASSQSQAPPQQQQQPQQQPPLSVGSNGPQTPHTPHTPHTPGGPPSVPPQGLEGSGGPDSLAPDLSELSFDPAAVIDGEGQGQEGLNLLPESCVDAMELLSYLDPPDLGGGAGSTGSSHTGPTSSSTASGSTPANDDLLALFEP